MAWRSHPLRLLEAVPALSRSSVGVVFAAALAIASSVAALYLYCEAAGPRFALEGLPLDDAWIHQVYARSIASGQPFRYNPGESETGATSPLWAILLAPAHLLRIPPVAACKALGILCAAAAATAGFSLAARLGGRAAGLAFAALPLLLPYFAFASVSGTEVPLFVFLILLAMTLALAGHWRAAGLATGLGILARPEGYLFLALLVVARAATSDGNARWTARSLLVAEARTVLPAATVLAPWLVYCLAVSGRPLPSTFYVKAAWFGFFNLRQMQRIGAFLLAQPFAGAAFGSHALAGLGATLGGSLVVLGWWRLSRVSRAAFLLVGLFSPLYLYALSTEVALPRVTAPDRTGSVLSFYSARYLLPAAPTLLLCWLLGFAEIHRHLGRRLASWRSPARVAARLGLACTILVLPAISGIRQHASLRGVYSWNCQNIECQQVAAARWVAANLPPTAVVGTSDAGALRYFGGRRIVDLFGLNSHRWLSLLRSLRRIPPASADAERLADRFWHDARPDYLAITSHTHGALLAGRRFRTLAIFPLEKNTICDEDTLRILQPW